jgi:uncharacterized PurR-regulated membrane protein YhhQ (DUF165 family)
MLDRILSGVDRVVAYKLMLAHIIIIAISNYVVQFKFNVFGHPLAAAAFTFPLVVVLTDLTVRLIGKETGRAVINLAFIPAILVSMAVVKLGGAPDSVAFRIGLGSGVAYFISNLLDVYVFQYFREKYSSWWIAPALSCVASTFIDTYVFFGTAFAYGADEFMAANWHVIATNNSWAKIIVSLLVILPFYGVLLSNLQSRFEKPAEAQ